MIRFNFVKLLRNISNIFTSKFEYGLAAIYSQLTKASLEISVSPIFLKPFLYHFYFYIYLFVKTSEKLLEVIDCYSL